MEKINRKILVKLPREAAFDKFVNRLNDWWPKKYTWSYRRLREIKIDPRVDGLCTEIGPYNFRCDWGRVTGYRENEWIAMKWQINPQRVPEPNPDKASDITVTFVGHADRETMIELEHSGFDNHGDGADAYLKAMDSEAGWDYILQHYAEYCAK